MLDRIVVPLDGSALAESALPVAFALARAANAPLEVISVAAPVHAEAFSAPTRAITDWIPATGVHAAPYLEDLSERVWRDTHTRLITTLAHGPVVDRLVEYTRAETDLLVMSSHRHSGLQRAVFGSVANAVIRRASAPVLLVPPRRGPRLAGHPALFRQVLIPLDESEFSEEVLPLAEKLGRLADAQYSLIEVVVTRNASVEGIRLNGDSEAGSQQVRRAADAHVTRVRERLEAHGLEVTTAVVDHDSAAQGILEYASSTQAELIALSTHGRGGVRRLLMGSVASEVARAATVPVLIYRPRAAR